ncbi:CoA pyrophosphatase [Actinoalloteichus sp. AHMU CJ021]|uniref:NUDIX domain-containing protein n=1 Tax=Actinoalloteichus caeruleus DSM 43889 TaxID=1120930 RepID=A0ABT1JJN6_ACTCY|nr:CoA pyrophosphatase [Actinoalloteichus caeruleus]AUS78598.1 CoA pyrophosphatase [Actinoalloteichus sp. AHMU CJ021]MCP2332725.1 NUDIX domain-containing protein [Actinoalloteichus caeruleus DSM 43889]
MTERASAHGDLGRGGALVDPRSTPPWLGPLVAASDHMESPSPTAGGGVAESVRPAAVLVLFGEDGSPLGPGPDLLLLRRADGLTHHPGQVGFPGGVAEDGDDGPVAVAIREAEEEVGLHRAGVRPVALLPELYIQRSKFRVTPVIAHWRQPSPVRPVDLAETSAVARVPVRYLADPGNRFQVRHPSGYVGPAFAVPGMLVWGFTAGLISSLLSVGEWAEPWDATDIRDLADAWQAVEAPAGAGGTVGE